MTKNNGWEKFLNFKLKGKCKELKALNGYYSSFYYSVNDKERVGAFYFIRRKRNFWTMDLNGKGIVRVNQKIMAGANFESLLKAYTEFKYS